MVFNTFNQVIFNLERIDCCLVLASDLGICLSYIKQGESSMAMAANCFNAQTLKQDKFIILAYVNSCIQIGT